MINIWKLSSFFELSSSKRPVHLRRSRKRESVDSKVWEQFCWSSCVNFTNIWKAHLRQYSYAKTSSNLNNVSTKSFAQNLNAKKPDVKCWWNWHLETQSHPSFPLHCWTATTPQLISLQWLTTTHDDDNIFHFFWNVTSLLNGCRSIERPHLLFCPYYTGSWLYYTGSYLKNAVQYSWHFYDSLFAARFFQSKILKRNIIGFNSKSSVDKTKQR